MTVALSERLAGAEILSLACDAAHDHQTAKETLENQPKLCENNDLISG